MVEIHSTAIVSTEARLGVNVKVGPMAIIKDDVEIGDNSIIGSKSVVYDGARIGSNVTILNSASIAHIPQDKKFHGEYSLCIVEPGSIIYDFVTLHRGTEASGKTIVGKNVVIMHYSHIAHDCYINDDVFIDNCVQIGGHVEVGAGSVLESYTQIHQFCKLGKFVTLITGCKATMDVPPFIRCSDKPLKYKGLSEELLRRSGFDENQIKTLNSIYNTLYNSGLNISQAKEKIKDSLGGNELASEVLNFINASSRGIISK
jgi:UDP-N-acetylglucosamine acyltransferase